MVEILQKSEKRTGESQPLGIESKLGELVQIAEELFPGPVSVDIETDPELPSERYAVFNVTATGDMTDVINRHRTWHERTALVVPDHCDKIRLSIDIQS